MPSRTPYVALTPELADFSHLGQSISEVSEDGQLEEPQSRWNAAFSSVRASVDNNVGMLQVVTAQVFFSLMNSSVKILNTIDPPVSTIQIIGTRMGLTWIICVTYMLWAKVPDPFLGPKNVRPLLLLRAFSGFVSLFALYFSLRYLSISDAVVLTFLAPFFTGVAGSVFLGESFSRKAAAASLFSLFGVVLIARPAFLFGHVEPIGGNTNKLEAGTPAQRLMAVGVALLGVMGATGAYITIRAIGDRASALHAMVAFSMLSTIFASVAFVVTKEPLVIPTRWDWVLHLFSIGIFGFIAQVFLTMGMQRETLRRSTMGLYSQVVFVMFLERIFFKSSPSVLSLAGTFIILSSALYVALTKESTKPKLDSILLDDVSDDLEEGLLEEDVKSESNRKFSRINTPLARESQSAGVGA